MILYLVRHGETAYNRDGLGLGRADVPLTDGGRLQAEAIGRRLAREPLERIYSSPLSRALDTGRLIAAGRGIPVEPRGELIELDVGATEGLAFTTIRERYGAFIERWASPEGHMATMPSGESMADLDARAGPFFVELRDSTAAAVAVVSHNFVLRVLICRAIGLELRAFRSIATGVASISAVRFEGRRVSVLFANDTCHLASLNLPAGEGSVNSA